jgi:heavy metal sensor kinase
MQINSIRFKASILYSGILTVILIVFSLVVFLSARSILYHDLDENLEIKAEEISGILKAYQQLKQNEEHPLGMMLKRLRNEGLGMSQKLIIDELWKSELDVLNLKDDFINILNIQGQAVMNSNNFNEELGVLFKDQFPFSIDKVQYKNLTSKTMDIRAINLPTSFHNAKIIVQVGTSTDPVEKLLRRLITFISLTIIAILVLTSFIGQLFAQNILKPVVMVSQMADNITHQGLTNRITEKQNDVEMQQLVNSFNSMINRLDKSFTHINEFSSHVAHELKTPLAIMRGEIELALDQEHDSKEYKKVLTNNLDEIDRMVKIVKDLLLLAKLDYKPEIFKFEKFDLHPFFTDLYEHSKVLASSKNINMNLKVAKDDVYVNADKTHLRRLFLNLINNAVLYTPSNGKIDLIVSKNDSKVLIDVKDSGEGISPENINKIFDKFYRVPKDADKKEPGSGLGLNIAQSIAKAHKGEITVKSQPSKGTTFTVTLPLA